MFLALISICIFCIIFFNLLFDFSWSCVLDLFIGYALVLLPSLFIAIFIRFLPKKWFNSNNSIYYVSEKERNFLIRIGIKKWKNKIPDLGQLVKFKKDKLYNANNQKYIEKFLVETCYAETLHISCAISALIFMFFMPNGCFWNISFPIGIIYAMFNMPSVLIQRYNRPRLKVQLKRLTKAKINDNIINV